MPARFSTAAAGVGLMFALAACAAGPPHGDLAGAGRHGSPPRGPGPAEGRPSLFISPAGEPFRTTPARGDPRSEWLQRVDPAGGGAISADALVADARRYFDVLDRDHNGAIEGPEVTAYETQIVPEILSVPGRGLQGAARFGLLNDPQPIRSADFNLDYRVTLTEYERKARETFTRLDANQDGVLRVSELPPPPSLAPPRPGGRPGPPPGGGRGGRRPPR